MGNGKGKKNGIGAREGGIGEHVGKEQKILTDQSLNNPQ